LQGSIEDKKGENKELRKMLTEFSEQIKALSGQNTYMSKLLTAPRKDAEPMRSANVRVTEVTDDDTDDFISEIIHDEGDEITDFTDEITPDDDKQHETKSSPNQSGEELHHEQGAEEISKHEDI